MTQNVNPNSRASFTDREGKLTKYGMEVIGALYRALSLLGDSNAINDLQDQVGDLGLLPGLLAQNAALSKKIGDIESSMLDPAVFSAHIGDLSKRISETLDQIPETATMLARICRLEQKISELEQDSQPVFPTQSILKRLDDIEAQL